MRLQYLKRQRRIGTGVEDCIEAQFDVVILGPCCPFLRIPVFAPNDRRQRVSGCHNPAGFRPQSDKKQAISCSYPSHGARAPAIHMPVAALTNTLRLFLKVGGVVQIRVPNEEVGSQRITYDLVSRHRSPGNLIGRVPSGRRPRDLDSLPASVGSMAHTWHWRGTHRRAAAPAMRRLGSGDAPEHMPPSKTPGARRQPITSYGPLDRRSQAVRILLVQEVAATLRGGYSSGHEVSP